jgi:hypothetical protein
MSNDKNEKGLVMMMVNIPLYKLKLLAFIPQLEPTN